MPPHAPAIAARKSVPITVMMDLPPFYAGNLLLAMPSLSETEFHQSVIALCVHDGEGAMGIDIGSEMGGLGLRELLSTSISTAALFLIRQCCGEGLWNRSAGLSCIRSTGAAATWCRSTIYGASPGRSTY